MVSGGLLGVWRQHIPHLGILLQPVYWTIWTAPSLEWGQKQEIIQWQSRAIVKQPCHLGAIQCGNSYSAGGIGGREDTGWSFWKIPVREPHHSVLRFWSKAMASTTDDYTPFEKVSWHDSKPWSKQYLTNGHKVTMYPPEQPTVAWVASDLLRHKVSHVQ